MRTMIKTGEIFLKYTEYDNPDELGREDKELIEEARNAATNAYAPYSRFKVGAAIRLMSNKIVKGANVENAAFPSGLCAERTAISNCVSNYPGDKPVTIAIAAMYEDTFTEEPVPPCGNCRQVITEEESKNDNKIRVILSGKSKILIFESCSHLLPIQFNSKNLNLH